MKSEKSKRDLRCLRLVICNLMLLLFAVFSFCGCANGMALAKKQCLANPAKPIGIFTLRTENTYKPSYQPEVKRVIFRSDPSGGNTTFAAGKPYREGKNEYLEYLISVDLPSAGYSIERIEGVASGFLISGHFEFPIKARFTLDNGVTYLGHVKMINRKRNEGEERAGMVIPMIDQSVCGFSGGTFDITVTDRSEADILDFVRAYPALKDVNITKAIMKSRPDQVK